MVRPEYDPSCFIQVYGELTLSTSFKLVTPVRRSFWYKSQSPGVFQNGHSYHNGT